MAKRVKCFDCIHERGLGLNAWCDVRPKNHSIREGIVCDCFFPIQLKKTNNKNKYTDIEVNEAGTIVLWKGDNGQKFTSTQFLKFLNEKINGD